MMLGLFCKKKDWKKESRRVIETAWRNEQKRKEKLTFPSLPENFYGFCLKWKSEKRERSWVRNVHGMLKEKFWVSKYLELLARGWKRRKCSNNIACYRMKCKNCRNSVKHMQRFAELARYHNRWKMSKIFPSKWKGSCCYIMSAVKKENGNCNFSHLFVLTKLLRWNCVIFVKFNLELVKVR